MKKACLAMLALSSPCWAKDVDAEKLVEFSLESLMKMDIEVTASAKREQRSFDTSAAIFVITDEDIKRLGITNIPDALRMAPGVQVAQLDNNEWAISVRGLGGRFSKYLQVLVDGRSVYDNLLSTVNWDEVNLSMADIERIEVLRGPGASVWGSNAVNGVINIVTKTPNAMDGGNVIVGAGNYQKSLLSGRVSFGVGEQTEVRVSGNRSKRNGLESLNQGLVEGDATDERISLALAHHQNKNEWLFNLDVYQLHNDNYWINGIPSVVAASGGMASVQADEDKHGYAAQLRFIRSLGEKQSINLRLSVDDIKRESEIFSWDTGNIDADLEYVAELGDHYLTLGSNNRMTTTKILPGPVSQFTLDPAEDDTVVNSLFLHDTVTLNDAWQVDLGLRYEKQSETGDNVQGTLRTSWKLTDNRRVWAAVSKADGIPSRVTTSSSRSSSAILPERGGIPPVLIYVISDGETLENVELTAYEMGYRHNLSKTLTLDAALFYNDYSNILSTELLSVTPIIDPVSGQPYIESEVKLNADQEISSSGVELTFTWQPSPAWNLQYSGSYMNLEHELDGQNKAVSSLYPAFNMLYDVPRHQHSLRVMTDINQYWSAGMWLRYVDELALVQVDSYTVADLQVSYKPRPDLVLSLVGKNLGDRRYTEGLRDAYFVDTFEVESSVLATVNWSF